MNIEKCVENVIAHNNFIKNNKPLMEANEWFNNLEAKKILTKRGYTLASIDELKSVKYNANNKR